MNLARFLLPDPTLTSNPFLINFYQINLFDEIMESDMPNDRSDKNTRLISRTGGAAHGTAQPAASAPPKTRIIGTRLGEEAAKAAAEAGATDDTPMADAPDLPVTGWLVVMKGPGQGKAVEIHEGLNDIGRDPERAICLDFGDGAISREAHAILVYEPRERSFFFNHAGQRNLVRLNETAVMTPQQLNHGDMLEIGETHLRFVAFCGPDFDWAELD